MEALIREDPKARISFISAMFALYVASLESQQHLAMQKHPHPNLLSVCILVSENS